MITVQTTIPVPIARVWEYWTEPAHIMQWNQASDDWHTTAAHNDVRVGGVFCSTMAAKDGSMSFDFAGTYTDVIAHRHLTYALGDTRIVHVDFTPTSTGTHIVEQFTPETTHSHELQQAGWQAILDSFARYAIAQSATH